jgi:hypothetical protein
MDAVRWVVLILLFAGLLGLWLWSKRQARLNHPRGKAAAPGFKVTQKRWLDQRTGVCLVEAEGQGFLLAYTVGGGVSWQPVAKSAAAPAEDLANVEDRPAAQKQPSALHFETILSEAGLR